MAENLNVLFIPLDAIGHVNACIGLAERLIQSGHTVSFILNEQFKGRLEPYGIREILLKDEDRDAQEDPARDIAKLALNAGMFNDKSPIESLEDMARVMPMLIARCKHLDETLERLLPDLRPDAIIVDYFLCLTSVVRSGIPWVFSCSGSPLGAFEGDNTPPGGSGLPINGPKNDWEAYRNARNKILRNALKEYIEFLGTKGVTDFPDYTFAYLSPYLNVYGFPLELDYTDVRPLPKNWVRFDNLMRKEKHQKFQIPDQLKDKPGKLVYFSLGSMGGANVHNMNRLLAILAKSKHRFIVSKGPMHESIILWDNMWGQQSVPQIQVLPFVDLVITHGGNNTITETFYFGKPVIVMPLGADQYDNAQRVHEKGYGLRLNAYKCSEEELLSAIDRLLNDNALTEKLSTISKRIQSEDSLAKLPKLIEDLVNKYKK